MLTIAILMTVFLALILIFMILVFIDLFNCNGFSFGSAIVATLLLAFCTFCIVGTWLLYSNIH